MQCPKCQNEVNNLLPVDSGLRGRLNLAGQSQDIFPAVCSDCIGSLEQSVGHGSVLMAQEKARGERKLNLWKGRVKLLKNGRQAMARKSYGEAAVAYEKYLKVIDIIFETTQDKLNPEDFKKRAVTKEISVVASVYWDLVRIYDTSEKYRTRLLNTVKKLIEFAPYTPIISDLLKKAEVFKRKARNSDLINNFIKQTSNSRKKCFIATAAFSGAEAPEVRYLTQIRDDHLIWSIPGRAFIFLYYLISPWIAKILDHLPVLRPIVRVLLHQIISILQILLAKPSPRKD